MRCCDLFEGVGDHLLYHLLTADKASHVAQTNTMEARWEHLIDGRRVKGNSFSRNRQFTFGAGPDFRYQGEYPIRLVVDRRALAARHRIIPVDAEIVHRNTYRPGGFVKPDRHNTDSPDTQYAEEFVVGTIRQLHRFITVVEVNPVRSVNGRLYSTYLDVRHWCNHWQIPFRMDDRTRQACRDFEDHWAEDEEDGEPVRMFEQAEQRPAWFTAGQLVDITDEKWDAGEFLGGDEFDYEWRLCRVPADFVTPAMLDPEESNARKADILKWQNGRDLDKLLMRQPPVMVVGQNEQLICDGNHRAQVAKEQHLPEIPMLVAFGEISPYQN